MDLVGRSRIFPHFRKRLLKACDKLWNPWAQQLSHVIEQQVDTLRHSGVIGPLFLLILLMSYLAVIVVLPQG